MHSAARCAAGSWVRTAGVHATRNVQRKPLVVVAHACVMSSRHGAVDMLQLCVTTNRSWIAEWDLDSRHASMSLWELHDAMHTEQHVLLPSPVLVVAGGTEPLSITQDV